MREHRPTNPDDLPSRHELEDPPAGLQRLEFFVPGRPQPAGSKRGFPIRRAGALTGRVAITDDNPKSRDWKSHVAACAFDALASKLRNPNVEPPLLEGPLGMSLLFTVGRPKGHFGTGRNVGIVKAGAPAHPCSKPDTTKLVRAVEDALTAVLWRDDAQVVEQYAAKLYGDREGVKIAVWKL